MGTSGRAGSVWGACGRAGICRRDLRKGRNWSWGTSAGPQEVVVPFGRSGSGRGALREVQKRSGSLWQGGNCSGALRQGEKWSGALRQVWKCSGALRQGRKWSGALQQGRKRSRGPPERPEEVGRHSGRVECGREALRQGRKWSGGPLAGPELIVSPSGRARSGREALQ